MQTILVLLINAALALARPYSLAPNPVSITHTDSASPLIYSRNAPIPSSSPSPAQLNNPTKNYNTISWYVFLVFFILGCAAVALFPCLAAGPFFLRKYRERGGRGRHSIAETEMGERQRKESEIREYTRRMNIERPEEVRVPLERED